MAQVLVVNNIVQGCLPLNGVEFLDSGGGASVPVLASRDYYSKQRSVFDMRIDRR